MYMYSESNGDSLKRSVSSTISLCRISSTMSSSVTTPAGVGHMRSHVICTHVHVTCCNYTHIRHKSIYIHHRVCIIAKRSRRLELVGVLYHIASHTKIHACTCILYMYMKAHCQYRAEQGLLTSLYCTHTYIY